MYIILQEYNGRYSVSDFSRGVFLTKTEAKKYLEWHKFRIESADKAHEVFWKEKVVKVPVKVMIAELKVDNK